MDILRIPTFEPADEAILRYAGHLTPVVNGKRKVSWSTVSSSTSSEVEDLILPANTDVIQDTPTLEVPEFVQSRETYEILGFNAKTATDLFTNWRKMCRSLGDSSRYDMLEFAQGYITDCEVDDVEGDGNWAECLDEIGVSAKLKTAILDDKYKGLRSTSSAKYWVQDTLSHQYAAVNQIAAESESRTNLRKRVAGTVKQPRVGGPFSYTPEYHQDANKAGPSVALQYQIPAREVPGRTRLFKGTSKIKAEKILNSTTKDVSLSSVISVGKSLDSDYLLMSVKHADLDMF